MSQPEGQHPVPEAAAEALARSRWENSSATTTLGQLSSGMRASLIRDAHRDLKAALPAIEASVLARLKERLTVLHNGTGPNWGVHYQDGWRHGIRDAKDLLEGAPASLPDEEE